MKYCNQCGATLSYSIPEDDDRKRYICNECQHIHYENPKIVVGTVPVEDDGRILLCKRAIAPRNGFWTLPAGFLENGETLMEGALRETYEEACVKIVSGVLYRMYDLPFINQIYIFFYAQLHGATFAAGRESTDVALFTADNIPWDELAFPVVGTVLKEYLTESSNGIKVPASCPYYQILSDPFSFKKS